MLAAHPVGGHAGQSAACEGQRDEVEFCNNLQGQPRVRARVFREPREVVAESALDVEGAITAGGGFGLEFGFEFNLAFAEHFAGDAVQRVVVEALKGTANEIDAVEHEPARNRGLAAAEVAARGPNADRAGVPAEVQRRACALRDALQDVEVEVDDVPAGQDVGIDFPNAGDESRQCIAFGRAGNGALGHGATGVVNDMDLVNAFAEHGDGKQLLGRRIGFDVERKHRRCNHDVRRLHDRLVEDFPERGVGGGRVGYASDLAATPDAAVDQVADGEADVRLEGRDTMRVQSVA